MKGGLESNDQTETLRPPTSSPEPPPIFLDENSKTEIIPSFEKDKLLPLLEKDKEAESRNDTPVINDVIKEKENKTAPSNIKKHVVVIEGDAPLYMIQLAAFRSELKAKEIAKILSQKHKSRLNEVDLKTMQVDTGINGVFYRIVSLPLPRQNADVLCSVLRRSGQDCFIRKYIAASP